MTKLSEAKIFGGIGALLSLFILIPHTAGPLIGIIGLILVFIAVKYIADETKNNSIYKNYLMTFVLFIIALVAVIIIMIAAFGMAGGFSWLSSLQEKKITDFNSFWNEFGDIFVGLIAAGLVAWVLLIIATLYIRKSYDSIAAHTKVDLFKTTGLVYFIGAVSLIIIIGIFILIVAKILEIIAFFSLPENLPAVPETTTKAAPP